MEAVLAATAHRVHPLPCRPWSVAMRWHDLLFAHWPIEAASLRKLLPRGLEVDTFDGQAWIGVVPFHMTGIRFRRFPSLCCLAFPELNVRTYVKRRGKSGVWFLSLDAASRLGVCVAKTWYRLPYHRAKMHVAIDGDEVTFSSRRVGRGASPAVFQARYQPTGPVVHADPGTLEHWLTERYALFATDGHGRIGCGDIHHVVWPLQPAEAEIPANTMLEPLGLQLTSQPPLLHFAKRIDAVAWSVEWDRA